MRSVLALALAGALGAAALAGCGGSGKGDLPTSDGPTASPAAVRRTLASIDACALLTKSGIGLADVERTRPHRCEAKLGDFPVSVIIGVPFGTDDRRPDARVDLDGLAGYRSSTSQQVVIAVGTTYGIAVTDEGDLPTAVAHALAQDPDGFDSVRGRSAYAACDLLALAVPDSSALIDARGATSADQGLDMCGVRSGSGDALPRAALQNSDASIDRAAEAASSKTGVFDLGGYRAYTQSLGASGCVVQVLIDSDPDNAGGLRYTYAGFTESSCARARSTATAAIRRVASPPPKTQVPLSRLLTSAASR